VTLAASAVEEGECRNRAVEQPPEDLMPELGHLHGLPPLADQRHALDVGTRGKHERFASHPDGGHPRDVSLDLVQCGGQARQRGWPEGGRPRVIASVVERYERELTWQTRNVEIADEGLGNDLVRKYQAVRRRHERAPVYCGFSQITLPPCPSPTHIAVRP
jgi:hypothetical protein